jgi:hypothetical protein
MLTNSSRLYAFGLPPTTTIDLRHRLHVVPFCDLDIRPRSKERVLSAGIATSF